MAEQFDVSTVGKAARGGTPAHSKPSSPLRDTRKTTVGNSGPGFELSSHPGRADARPAMPLTDRPDRQ